MNKFTRINVIIGKEIKMKTIKITAVIAVISSVLIGNYAVYASEDTFSFHRDVDWNVCIDSIKNELNTAPENTKRSGRTFTYYDEDEIKNSDYNIYYGIEISEFAKYSGGNFEDFIEKNCNRKWIKAQVYSDEYMAAFDYSFEYGRTIVQRMGKLSNPLPVKNKIAERLGRYCDGGKIYYVDVDIPFIIAVLCDENDEPKYIAYVEDFTGFECNNENSAEVKRFAKMLGEGIDSKYKQFVFDFDYYLNITRAVSDMEAEFDYDKKNCFESGFKNKVASIDGKAYYFDKNGRCKGRCNGWVDVRTSDGSIKKRYYQNGEMLVGKWKINGVVYVFDKNGYVVNE